ncbi:MAG: sugar transferase, partial [Angelakisella sp.]
RMRDELQLEAVQMNDTTLLSEERKRSRTQLYLCSKRVMDIFLSAAALVFLLPVFVIVALAIVLEDRGPVMFCQTRIGKDNIPFTMYKFRSMCLNAEEKLAELARLNERDGPVFKIAKDPRITKVGNFIRKTCIDELPQLINIIKGDMSIVGPRPPLPKEVLQYSQYSMQRLRVTPGLTCFWQVQKGANTTFEEWVALDIKYINERNLWTDAKLIFMTIKVVLSGRGEF